MPRSNHRRRRGKHGELTRTKAGQRLYFVWASMIARCHNENHPAYRWYGARGISVCLEWRESFAAFHADMGFPPPGLTLDRIENDEGYFKLNCAWRSYSEQNANQRKRTRHGH